MLKVILIFTFTLIVGAVYSQLPQHGQGKNDPTQVNTIKNTFIVGINDIEESEIALVKNLKNQFSEILSVYFCDAQKIFRITFDSPNLDYDPITILQAVQNILPNRNVLNKPLYDLESINPYCKFE
ncbi:MAG: hypothetical protein ACK4K0_11600 [Flavobacteriales bacterium]